MTCRSHGQISIVQFLGDILIVDVDVSDDSQLAKTFEVSVEAFLLATALLPMLYFVPAVPVLVWIQSCEPHWPDPALAARGPRNLSSTVQIAA